MSRGQGHVAYFFIFRDPSYIKIGLANEFKFYTHM